MNRHLWLVLAALVAVLAVGCAAPAASSPSNVTPGAAGAESPLATPGAAAPVASPEATTDAATSPLATPASDLAPTFAEQAVAWLAQQANVPAGKLRLVGAERAEWTDSCFGLGGPAESCLQASTPGWRLTLEADGQQYEVRTDQAGTAFRLAPQAS